VNEQEIEQMREQARQMQEQAARMLEAADAAETVEDAAPETVAPVVVGEEWHETISETPGSAPGDEEAVVDPPEKMDMAQELDGVRGMLGSRGFARKASTADGEVWERPGPRGEQGWRALLVSTPHGRIRLELRNPMGFIVTQAEPATVIDSEIVLNHVPS
jgi:hypothetical protein